MNVIDRLRKFLINKGLLERPKISLLIPFSSADPSRHENFNWLKRYWKCKLPHAEIIIGESKSHVFCKGEALNDAFEQSTGKVIVVLDADALIDHHVVNKCADRILEAQHHGYNLWYVPYKFLYRLTKDITKRIIHSDPCHPLFPTTPPDECDVDNWGDVVCYGHLYAAMITIFPRKAMDVIKCFDQSFVGWGGEDVSFLRAMDCLFGKHKITGNAVFHMNHPQHGKTHKERTWDNQEKPNASNWKRASRYHHAYRKVSKMEELMNENYGYYQSKKNFS